MVKGQRATDWIGWMFLVSVGVGGWAGLPGDRAGSWAIAADSTELTTWRFNPDRQQLEVLLPSGATPRYFLLAQPARIVLDLPAVDIGAISTEQTYGGAVQRVRVAQFEPGLARIVLELAPSAVLAPGQVELTAVETLASGATRWTLRPLFVDEGDGNGAIAAIPPTVSSAPTETTPAPSLIESSVPPALETMPPPTVAMGGNVDEPPVTAIPQLEPAPLPDTPDSMVPSPEPSIQREIPSLAEADLLESLGAEGLATEAVGIPSSPPTNPATLGLASTVDDETLTSATFPDAVEIPIDFPSPTLSPPSATTNAPVAIAVPPPEPAEMLETPAVAAAPTNPNLLLPSGTTLRLRYPRTSSLALTDQPWQEVLVVTDPVQDAQGTVLIPAGSQVIGRFEQDGRGHRFIAQAIALDAAIVQLQGASPLLVTEGSIAPNAIIDLAITQDLLRSP